RDPRTLAVVAVPALPSSLAETVDRSADAHVGDRVHGGAAHGQNELHHVGEQRARRLVARLADPCRGDQQDDLGDLDPARCRAAWSTMDDRGQEIQQGEGFWSLERPESFALTEDQSIMS